MAAEAVIFGSHVTVDGKCFEYGKYFACHGNIDDANSYIDILEVTFTASTFGGKAVKFPTRSIDHKPGRRHSENLVVKALANDATKEEVEACTLKEIRESFGLISRDSDIDERPWCKGVQSVLFAPNWAQQLNCVREQEARLRAGKRGQSLVPDSRGRCSDIICG